MKDKIKIIKLILILIPLIIATLYLGGLISQFLYNYEIWKYEQEQTTEMIAAEFPSTSFLNCIKAIMYFPQGPIGIVICLIAYTIIFLYIFKPGNNNGTLDKERNFVYSELGTYGTSGFMEKSKITKVFDLHSKVKDCSGTILGLYEKKILSAPINSRINRNIAVYGASGSMKSRAFARNMIFQCVKRGESLFITDPKAGAKRCNTKAALQTA